MNPKNKETLEFVIKLIRDICIALLAALTGTAMLTSCGVTTRAYVHNNADATTTISIKTTSPQNYNTSVLDSLNVKIK